MSCILKPLFFLPLLHGIFLLCIFDTISCLPTLTLSAFHQNDKKAPQKMVFLHPRTNW